MSAALAWLERRWLPVSLGLLLLTTGLSLLPAARMPAAAAAHDKLEHLVAYAAIVLPIALARPRGWPAMIAGVAAWSWGIELLQPLVNRSQSLGDFATNLAGAALGLLLGLALGLALRRGR